MTQATDPDLPRQPGGPPYRAMHRGGHPGEWLVASGTPDAPGPAVLTGFKTEKHAQEAADTLNGLDLDGPTDRVLVRMFNKPHSRRAIKAT